MALALLCFAPASTSHAQSTSADLPAPASDSEGIGNAPTPEAGSSVSIAWSAPAACPAPRELERHIELLLRRPLTAPRAHAIAVRGAVVALEDGGYEVVIRATAELGPSERLVRHQNCASLTEAAALVIALAIDPEAINQQAATCPAIPPGTELLPVEPAEWAPVPPTTVVTRPCETPKPPRCPALRPTPHCPASKSPESTPRGATSLELAAGGGATARLLPETAPFLAVSLGARIAQRFQLQLHGRYWQRQQLSIEGHADAHARLRPRSLALRGCWLPIRPSWTLALCTGGEAGVVVSEARGSTFSNRLSTNGFWWGWTAAIVFDQPLSRRWFLRSGLDGALVVQRPEVGFSNAGVWTPLTSPERILGGMHLALGVRLP